MNNVKENILNEAGNVVNGARREAYGTPEDNFSRIAMFWNTYLHCTGREMNLTTADVSPMMRLMKEARLCESPDHRDSFVDIIGYALTGAEINLPAEEPEEPKSRARGETLSWHVYSTHMKERERQERARKWLAENMPSGDGTPSQSDG